jgi:hypothetical protein
LRGGFDEYTERKGGNSLSQLLSMSDDQDSDGKLTGEDEIDEALEESFPASDPPGWTLGVDADHRSANGEQEDEGERDPSSGNKDE